MKTLTTLTCAMAAIGAVAFCAPNAKAQLGTLTAYSDLNIQLTVSISGPSDPDSKDNVQWKITKYHGTNKEILESLEGSDFYNDTFPTGARLVVAWSGDFDGSCGDVVVVDKTGTNVIYNASAGTISGSGETGTYAYLRLDYDSDQGALSGSFNIDDPATDMTCYMDGKFEFKDYNDGINFKLEAKDASSTEHFTQGINAAKAEFTSWSDSETMKIGDHGDQYFNEDSDCTVKGTITANGSGKGVAPYMLPEFSFEP